MDVDGLNEPPEVADIIAAGLVGVVYIAIFAAVASAITGYVSGEQVREAAALGSLQYGE